MLPVYNQVHEAFDEIKIAFVIETQFYFDKIDSSKKTITSIWVDYTLMVVVGMLFYQIWGEN